MVGWHHWLNGHELEQTPEDSEGQGSLSFAWGCKELDMTYWLNNIHVLNTQEKVIGTNIEVVQSPSHVQLFAAPWSAACQASLSFTISRSWLKLMFIESTMPSNYLIFCHPLPLLPSIFPSIRVFPSIRNDHRFIDKIISSALWEITNKQEHFYNIKGLALFWKFHVL